MPNKWPYKALKGPPMALSGKGLRLPKGEPVWGNDRERRDGRPRPGKGAGTSPLEGLIRILKSLIKPLIVGLIRPWRAS